MEFPDEVLTTNKKGKVEVRNLIDTGTFVRYEYLDPESGDKSENKFKLVLKDTDGSIKEELFIIPMKDSRSLVIPTKVKGDRKLWDPKQKMSVDL
jgi:hypothetical protein